MRRNVILFPDKLLLVTQEPLTVGKGGHVRHLAFRLARDSYSPAHYCGDVVKIRVDTLNLMEPPYFDNLFPLLLWLNQSPHDPFSEVRLLTALFLVVLPHPPMNRCFLTRVVSWHCLWLAADVQFSRCTTGTQNLVPTLIQECCLAFVYTGWQFVCDIVSITLTAFTSQNSSWYSL